VFRHVDRAIKQRLVGDGAAGLQTAGGGDDALGVESSIRVASSRAAKPPNTTEWIAPMRAQASMAKTASGTIGM
jgi:hypothetical protein